MKRKEATKWLIRPIVSSTEIGEIKARELKAYQLAIEALSEPKTGEWKQISPARIYECSECGQMVKTGNIGAYKFCHGCGVMMKCG